MFDSYLPGIRRIMFLKSFNPTDLAISLAKMDIPCFIRYTLDRSTYGAAEALAPSLFREQEAISGSAKKTKSTEQMGRVGAKLIEWPRINRETIEKLKASPYALHACYRPHDGAATSHVSLNRIGNDSIQPGVIAGRKEDKVLTTNSDITMKCSFDHQITLPTR